MGIESTFRNFFIEHTFKLEQSALMQQLQHEIFEAMRICDADERLLDAIIARGEACTPKEKLPWSDSPPNSKKHMS